MASITSHSLGDEFFSRSAVAETSIPGMQAPHCAAPWERNDCCKRLSTAELVANPSTVVISHPPICPTATRHEHTGSPFSSTVQAPQSPASHPTLVPVSPRSSRKTRDRRRVPQAFTSAGRPFTENTTDSTSAVLTGLWVVAMSDLFHTGFQRSADQGQRCVAAILGRGAHIIDGRKRGKMLGMHECSDSRNDWPAN